MQASLTENIRERIRPMKTAPHRIHIPFLLLICLALPGISHAFSPFNGCWDTVQCRIKITAFNSPLMSYEERMKNRFKPLGEFHVSTCFSLTDFGCRPWGCQGDNRETRPDYWNRECEKRFAKRIEHLKSDYKIKEYEVFAKYPPF